MGKREKEIKALEKLLEDERDALQEVLEACRNKMKEYQKRHDAMAVELGEEKERRLSLQDEMAAMQRAHRAELLVYEKHVSELRESVKHANLARQAAIRKGEEDL